MAITFLSSSMITFMKEIEPISNNKNLRSTKQGPLQQQSFLSASIRYPLTLGYKWWQPRVQLEKYNIQAHIRIGRTICDLLTILC